MKPNCTLEDNSMTQTKTRPAQSAAKNARSKQPAPKSLEVLTLAEAATYLRVEPHKVLDMVAAQGLPGRQFGTEWRFLRAALQGWLSTPGKKPFWETHFGALKDDPHLEEMLAEIYRRRGRPETEEH
jgi:excisionase family DNA binding protein